MLKKAIFYLATKGPVACYEQWRLRTRKKAFAYKNRIHTHDHRTIPSIARAQWLADLPYHDFFTTHAAEKYLNATTIAQLAHDTTNYTFLLFEKHHIAATKLSIPWHYDCLYRDQNPKSDEIAAWEVAPVDKDTPPYCFDITVPDTATRRSPAPDMRVCWELARLHSCYILGKAHSNSPRNSSYSKTFRAIIDDWRKKNPYLYGINWVCPMEVAIRAINLIWGLSFFYDDQTISAEFWQSYITLLGQHMDYLEHTWEKSWNPHNHYLSNLIGYLYLTKFFGKAKEHNWCIREIVGQLRQQILPDGTHFEGSSRYHDLVAELVLHAIIVIDDTQITAQLKKKFASMRQLSNHLSISDTQNVIIGDDDSGKILTGLRVSKQRKITHHLTHYPNFGLSIVQDSAIHLTFRHPTYTKHQPSGHFHEDELSITLALDGIPILIDPGSYAYTGNPEMRNLFRGVSSHNNLHLTKDSKQPDASWALFELYRQQQEDSAIVSSTNDSITMRNSMRAKENTALTIWREVLYTQAKNSIVINDGWLHTPTDKKMRAQDEYHGQWHFIFHPNIMLTTKDHCIWSILHKGEMIASLRTPRKATIEQSWYAPYYQHKITCTRLSMHEIIYSKEHYQTTISW